MFFGWHVLRPGATKEAPFSGPFEWCSIVRTIGGLVALWRLKVGIMPVIDARALAGLGYSLLLYCGCCRGSALGIKLADDPKSHIVAGTGREISPPIL